MGEALPSPYESPLQEVKIHEPNFPKGEALMAEGLMLSPYDTYTAITIDPYNYTLEEQIMLYPTVIVHKWPSPQNVVIDVE
jgi:hypothetical protein